MHVKPLSPVRTASWLLFSASSVHCLGTPSEASLGRRHQAQPVGLINLSCFLLFRKMKNTLHAKSTAQSRTFVQSIRSNSNPKIHYPPQCLLQHRKSRLLFVWITPPALRRFRGCNEIQTDNVCILATSAKSFSPSSYHPSASSLNVVAAPTSSLTSCSPASDIFRASFMRCRLHPTAQASSAIVVQK
jgi:hypothetical protein